jgi:hypothetical protein
MFQIWQWKKGKGLFDVETIEQIKAMIQAGEEGVWIIEHLNEKETFWGEEAILLGSGYKKEDGTVVFSRELPWDQPLPRVVQIPGVDSAKLAHCNVRWGEQRNETGTRLDSN